MNCQLNWNVQIGTLYLECILVPLQNTGEEIALSDLSTGICMISLFPTLDMSICLISHSIALRYNTENIHIEYCNNGWRESALFMSSLCCFEISNADGILKMFDYFSFSQKVFVLELYNVINIRQMLNLVSIFDTIYSLGTFVQGMQQKYPLPSKTVGVLQDVVVHLPFNLPSVFLSQT